MIEGLFTSKLKRDVLAAIILHPGKQFYIRELARRLKASEGSLHRELTVLCRAGIIRRTKELNKVYYQAQTESPIYNDLYNIMAKTVGLVDVLAGALKVLSKRIKVAFIYASFAKGSANGRSDVDMMVIGSCSFGRVVDAIDDAQEKLGREVNPAVYPVKEWNQKLKEKHHFITSVSKSIKIFIIGTEDDLSAHKPTTTTAGQ